MRATVCSGHDAAGVLWCLDSAIDDGFTPTLAIVFSSVSIDLAALGRGFHDRGILVVGASTAGEIKNDEILEDACVALLMDPAADSFEVHLESLVDGAEMFGPGKRLGARAVELFSNPSVVAFTSGVRTNGEPVVHGVRDGAGRPIPLVGGMAGDDLVMKDTFVFSGTEVAAQGIVALILDGDRFEVQGIATNGWQAVGVEKTITRSEGNTVYTIDGEPALDVYRSYLSIADVPGAEGQVTPMVLGVQYPLSVRRSDGSSVIRAPLFYQPSNQSLIFAGSIPEGSKVKFCIPPSIDIVERVVEEASGMYRVIPEADALLLVSCVARHLALGPLALDEVQGLHGLWNVPMAGYFSYGEFGAAGKGECDFHTETCTLVALREIPA